MPKESPRLGQKLRALRRKEGLTQQALADRLSISAAYLNLIEPWWKVLRSLALKGRRFETWAEIAEAVERATTYWNAHRHAFHWGRRRRHRPKRTAGIATPPPVR